MTTFFSGVRPGIVKEISGIQYELPVLYYRDDGFGLFYSIDKKRAERLMPTDRMRPVTLPNGRAVIGISAYNYIETSIGAYGEVAAGIPVYYSERKKSKNILINYVLNRRLPEIGAIIPYHPVTNRKAYRIGKDEWGYNKFMSDMQFNITPEFQECIVSDDSDVMKIHVNKNGMIVKDNNPIKTYTIKHGKVLRTVITQRGVLRVSFRTKKSFIEFGSHPMAKSILDLGISDNPFVSFYYLDRSGILPEGNIIEHNLNDSAMEHFFTYDGRKESGEYTIDYQLS